MDNFLLYIFKSTIIITCLSLVFRLLMSKETCFSLNRVILIGIIISGLLIPIVSFPQFRNAVDVKLLPEISANQIHLENIVVAHYPNKILEKTNYTYIPKVHSIPLVKFLTYLYFIGLFITLAALIKNVLSLIFILRKSKVVKIEGYRILISKQDMPSFAFANTIIISQNDYDIVSSPILLHERAHIYLKHFYDLLFLEIVKVFHWFNPAIYAVITNLKEVHEYQADTFTINSGADIKHYQLLLIEKCVGPQRFALANSFIHCQIKKRITMMNNHKISKAWRWKAAIFLPIVLVLLMSFSKKSVDNPKNMDFNSSSKDEHLNSVPVATHVQYEHSKGQVINIKNEGNYIGSKKCSLDEIVRSGKEWNRTNNNWITIQIDKNIDSKKVDEVREALRNSDVNFIVLSTTGSDKIIYFAGDVSSEAKFKSGKWNEWINNEVAKILGDKYKSDFLIGYFFIIDENGKVRDGHVVKPCNIIEVNAAYEKVLTKIPDWQPATRGGNAVSVYCDELGSQKMKY